MSSERRFSQKEIAAIFNRASKAQEKVTAEANQEEGLTLADLHLIALETGISPELITQAVEAVDQTPEEPTPKKFLGLQLSVSKTVNLDNPLTEDDWDKLVVEFRNSFRAQGKVTREGSLREWANGNLRILAEPTSKGHRLHMRSLKSNAQGAVFGSLSFVLAALAIFASAFFTGALDGGVLATSVMFGIFGVIAASFTTLQLSQWRFDRLEQFDSIATKALQLTSNRTVAENLSEKKKVSSTGPTTETAPKFRIEGHVGHADLLKDMDEEEIRDSSHPERSKERGR